MLPLLLLWSQPKVKSANIWNWIIFWNEKPRGMKWRGIIKKPIWTVWKNSSKITGKQSNQIIFLNLKFWILVIFLLLGSYYTYWFYYTYCSNFWWIVLFIFITALIFLYSYYTYCLKKKWIVLLVFIIILLFLLSVLF